jgi:hypothetical protein
MSIKLLKSRQQPPWGCILEGYFGMSGATANQVNIIVRFFTPNTDTEVAKTLAYTSSISVHLVNDTTNVVTSASPTDQATLNTLLNEEKADYNAHRVSTTYHNNADTTNAVTSANASDLATSITLANEIKADIVAHCLQATIHPYNDNTSWRLLDDTANATDYTTCRALALAIKSNFNVHLSQVTHHFYVYGITPGTYDIGIKNDACLSALAQDIVLTPGATIRANFVYLFIGDLNNDEHANSGDQGILNKTVGLGSPSTLGACHDYAGNWLLDLTGFGDWTVIPTARRKTY